MQSMQADGVGLGAYDFSAGIDLVLEQSEKIPWLAANLVNGQEKVVLPSYLIKTFENLKIALIGMAGTSSQNLQAEGYHFLAWQDALPELLKKLRKQADMIIVLSGLPPAENIAIAKKTEGIHIIFQAGYAGGNKQPQQIGNTILCQTTSRGKYLGVLEVDWQKSKKWGLGAAEQLKTERQHLDRILWQINRMERKNPQTNLTGNSKYDRLQHNKAESEKRIAQLEREIQKGSAAQACTFNNRYIPLTTSLPVNREVQAIVDQGKRNINKINKELQEEQRRKSNAARKAQKELAGLAGSQRCQECHVQQYDFWLSTAHASAYTTLEEKEQQHNPKCIACHVTLPGQKKDAAMDLALVSLLPQSLHNVGCETCHGPAKQHSQSPEDVLPAPVIERTCTACHSEERDDSFVFAKDVQLVRCPADTAMTK